MKKYVGILAVSVGTFLLGYYFHIPKRGISVEDISNLERFYSREIKGGTNISFREINSSQLSSYTDTERNTLFPKTDVIPTAEVATQVAVVVSTAKYGDIIRKQMPLKVCLVNGIWKIEGTVNSQKGGSVYLEINKKDGKVIFICHSK